MQTGTICLVYLLLLMVQGLFLVAQIPNDIFAVPTSYLKVQNNNQLLLCQ
jgi:hypothetical protein